VKSGFIIEPLGAHDRSAFSCGSPALDRYLREQASQDVKRLMASCFVVVETETNEIAGYYITRWRQRAFRRTICRPTF
jgi:hypothetical protein